MFLVVRDGRVAKVLTAETRVELACKRGSVLERQVAKLNARFVPQLTAAACLTKENLGLSLQRTATCYLMNDIAHNQCIPVDTVKLQCLWFEPGTISLTSAITAARPHTLLFSPCVRKTTMHESHTSCSFLRKRLRACAIC